MNQSFDAVEATVDAALLSTASASARRLAAAFKSAVRAENLSILPDGAATVWLGMDVWDLAACLASLGCVLACTSNDHAVLCGRLTYPRFICCRCKGRALDPQGRLAMLLSGSVCARAWHQMMAGEPRLGLDWLDGHGNVLHRCVLLSGNAGGAFIQLTKQHQPGGERGLRPTREEAAGFWSRADHSASVWVGSSAETSRPPARPWLPELRRRRQMLPGLGEATARPVRSDVFWEFLQSKPAHEPLDVTVLNDFVLQTCRFTEPTISRSMGGLQLAQDGAQVRFELNDLTDFWHINIREHRSVVAACEAYDDLGNLVFAARRTARRADEAHA